MLSLLLDLRLPVQPIYLYDDKRVSAPVEVQTMQRLRERLAEEHPHTRELMLPTRIDRVPASKPRDDIEQAFDAAMRTYRIGDQDAFLSRWCRDQGVPVRHQRIPYTPRAFPAYPSTRQPPMDPSA